MDKRDQDLVNLIEYIDEIDKEMTLLLQNLQWDQKHLLESPKMVSCKYVAEHRIPLHSLEAHEKQCFLVQEGYSSQDVLLPDPINANADTVVKLSKQDIMKVINTAASLDPSFRRGSGAVEPLTVERLEQTYTGDERRAIHDAVVAAAPACHELADLALGRSSSDQQRSKTKSRAEILAELRDMKRRRARYRVAAKTANYSDVLRDVIKTQMELYAEAKGIFIKTEYGDKTYVSANNPNERANNGNDVVIKQERISPDTYKFDDSERSRGRNRNPEKRRQRNEYEDRGTVSSRSRDRYVDNTDKRKFKDYRQDKHSKERRRYDDDYSKQKSYHKIKDKDRHDGSRKEEASTSKYRKHSEKDRQLNKFYNDYKISSKYETSSKEHDKYRNNREEYSRNEKYNYKRKNDEYERSKDCARNREENRYLDVKIKEEQLDYYEDCNNERRKRHRH